MSAESYTDEIRNIFAEHNIPMSGGGPKYDLNQALKYQLIDTETYKYVAAAIAALALLAGTYAYTKQPEAKQPEIKDPEPASDSKNTGPKPEIQNPEQPKSEQPKSRKSENKQVQSEDLPDIRKLKQPPGPRVRWSDDVPPPDEEPGVGELTSNPQESTGQNDEIPILKLNWETPEKLYTRQDGSTGKFIENIVIADDQGFIFKDFILHYNRTSNKVKFTAFGDFDPKKPYNLLDFAIYELSISEPVKKQLGKVVRDLDTAFILFRFNERNKNTDIFVSSKDGILRHRYNINNKILYQIRFHPSENKLLVMYLFDDDKSKSESKFKLMERYLEEVQSDDSGRYIKRLPLTNEDRELIESLGGVYDFTLRTLAWVIVLLIILIFLIAQNKSEPFMDPGFKSGMDKMSANWGESEEL